MTDTWESEGGADALVKATIIIDVKMRQSELTAYWDDPVDIILNGFGSYYGSSDVRIHRIGGVVVEQD